MNKANEYFVLFDRKRTRLVGQRLYHTIAEAEEHARLLFRIPTAQYQLKHLGKQTVQRNKRFRRGDLVVQAITKSPNWFCQVRWT